MADHVEPGLEDGDDSSRSQALLEAGGERPAAIITPVPSNTIPVDAFEIEAGSLPRRASTNSMITMQAPSHEELTPIDEVKELVRSLNLQKDGPMPLLRDVWEFFGGKSRLRCSGRCVTGPANVDRKFNMFAWTAIAAPSFFYFIFCAGIMWSVSPVLPVLTAVLLATTISLMLLTSCTDPGIIPRYATRLIVEGSEEEVAHALGIADLDIDIVHGARDEQALLLLETRGYRWCAFCKMIQPPRAKHCRDCNCCVLRNDHHCPFVNNCIGQRNYVYFCGFLFSLLLLGIAVFSGIFVYLRSATESRHSKIDERLQTILLCALAIPTAFFLLAVVCLSIFHACLICRGRTTREVLTGKRFGDGPTLMGERGPSLIHGDRRIRLPPQIQFDAQGRILVD